MELKDLLVGSEKSLPTLDQNLSTSTATRELPTITATPASYIKFGASAVAGLLGMYYLASGKKQNDVQKMVIGAALTLASFFIF
jgi:hypothetical protein